MDRLRAMETFVQVVESGSFAGAAHALGTSPAGVTRSIAEIEARLSTRLLQRSSRRTVLTEAGRVYVERCRRILDDVAEAEALVGASAPEPSGWLRVSAPVTFGTLHLGSVWPRFLARYPRIELDVEVADRFVDLLEEGVDAAVRIGRLESSSLIARRLATSRMVLCASPEYVRRNGAPRAPEDLASHRCIGYRYSMTRDEWEFMSPEGTAVRVAVRTRLHLNNGEMIHAALLAGEGLALQPTFIAGPALLTGALVAVMQDWPVPAAGIHVVYPSRRFLSGKVRALVDFLTEAVSDPPPWDAWRAGTNGSVSAQGMRSNA